MSWVLAVVLTVLALPPLVARAAGGRPPDPAPRLAALAPVATPVAIAGAAVAAAASWWLALLLAIPALTLLAWQLPPVRRADRDIAPAPQQPPPVGRTSRDIAPAPRQPPPVRRTSRDQLPPDRRAGREVAPAPQQRPGPGPGALPLRVLTLNVQGGQADPAAVVREIERHRVDVLVVQELDSDMAHRLADAGLHALVPFCHLDARPGRDGTGFWARWPLTPLPPVPGLRAAAPRARIEPADGWPVTLTGVHPRAPMPHNARRWQQELAAIRSALVDTGGQQVAAGDFNASRDHRPFRDLLAAGFLDCADAARRRSWPGFTWPADRRIPPVMRLDHVLVSRAGATVHEARVVQVPGTDHRGVLAVVELPTALSPEPRDRRLNLRNPGQVAQPGSCSATVSQRSSSEAFSCWTARSCAPSSISFS